MKNYNLDISCVNYPIFSLVQGIEDTLFLADKIDERGILSQYINDLNQVIKVHLDRFILNLEYNSTNADRIKELIEEIIKVKKILSAYSEDDKESG